MAYCFPKFLRHLNINSHICCSSQAPFLGQPYLPCHPPAGDWSLSRTPPGPSAPKARWSLCSVKSAS